MVCLNFEDVCDRVTIEMGLLFSFEYWCFLNWVCFLILQLRFLIFSWRGCGS